MFEAGATAYYENASVSLLAQTPSLAKNLNEPDDDADNTMDLYGASKDSDAGGTIFFWPVRGRRK